MLSALATLLSSCAGSGSTAPKNLPIAPSQRLSIANTVGQRLSTVQTDSSGLRDPAAIVAALAGTPGIINVQAQPDGSVTMQFTDGLPLTIVNDRPQVTSPSITSQTLSPLTVPANGNVAFENGLDATYNTLNTSQASASFVSGGYNGPSLGGSSVQELRQLGSRELGLLYFAGHGGQVAYLKDPTSSSSAQILGYGLWTSTVFSGEGFAAYKDDYYAHILGLMTDGQKDATGNYIMHYAILPAFIAKYKWTFSADSLVVLDACSTDIDEADSIRQALFLAGASSLVGWTAKESYGGSVSAFLFDRMLGAYKIAPIPNDKRPLSLSEAISMLPSFPQTPSPQVFVNQNDSANYFLGLEPTITSASVTGTTLTLSGVFGLPDGSNSTVSLNGVQATDVAMTSRGLTCTIPQSSLAQVPVIATVRTADGRTLTSNTVTVSDFSIVGNWNWTRTTDPVGSGTAYFNADGTWGGVGPAGPFTGTYTNINGTIVLDGNQTVAWTDTNHLGDTGSQGVYFLTRVPSGQKLSKRR